MGTKKTIIICVLCLFAAVQVLLSEGLRGRSCLAPPSVSDVGSEFIVLHENAAVSGVQSLFDLRGLSLSETRDILGRFTNINGNIEIAGAQIRGGIIVNAYGRILWIVDYLDKSAGVEKVAIMDLEQEIFLFRNIALFQLGNRYEIVDGELHLTYASNFLNGQGVYYDPSKVRRILLEKIAMSDGRFVGAENVPDDIMVKTIPDANHRELALSAIATAAVSGSL